jgi:hypothetical protein
VAAVPSATLGSCSTGHPNQESSPSGDPSRRSRPHRAEEHRPHTGKRPTPPDQLMQERPTHRAPAHLWRRGLRTARSSAHRATGYRPWLSSASHWLGPDRRRFPRADQGDGPPANSSELAPDHRAANAAGIRPTAKRLRRPAADLIVDKLQRHAKPQLLKAREPQRVPRKPPLCMCGAALGTLPPSPAPLAEGARRCSPTAAGSHSPTAAKESCRPGNARATQPSRGNGVRPAGLPVQPVALGNVGGPGSATSVVGARHVNYRLDSRGSGSRPASGMSSAAGRPPESRVLHHCARRLRPTLVGPTRVVGHRLSLAAFHLGHRVVAGPVAF